MQPSRPLEDMQHPVSANIPLPDALRTAVCQIVFEPPTAWDAAAIVRQRIATEQRRLCGRWLAMVRGRLGLTDDEASKLVGTDATTLLLIELGVARSEQVADAVRERLALAFSRTTNDCDLVMAVLEIALGDRYGNQEPILEQVVSDLAAPRLAPRR